MKKIIKYFVLLQIILLISCIHKNDDSRFVSVKPKEIYGHDKTNIVVRIGNGGAGPTGILRALAEDYLEERRKNYAIAWYQDISPNTLKQLQENVIDVALVYEKDQIELAKKENFATNETLIFNDHFLIVGPKNNPAMLDGKDSVLDAFKKISKFGMAQKQKIFLSRGDNSGTNIKEKSIWKNVNLEPWSEKNQWYEVFHAFPKDALLQADKEKFYTITDWGTFLSNKSLLKNTIIFVRGGELLRNPCYALLGKNYTADAMAFLNYLKSQRAQAIIANFGREIYGEPLFTKASQHEFGAPGGI